MLKVLFVLPNLGRNGAVDSTISLAEHLTGQNLSVEILALEQIGHTIRRPHKNVTMTFGVAGGATLRKKNVYLVSEAVVRAVRRSDITFISFEMGPALWFPAIIAFLLRRPTIVIVRSNFRLSVEYHPHYFWGKRVPATIEHVIRRWACRRARIVVGISEGLKPVIASEVDPKKIIVIPNGVDIDHVKRLAKQHAQLAVAENTKPYVLGLGRFSPEKGFDVLIRAHKLVIERGAEHRLIVLGDGDCEELKLLVEELGVSNSVHLHGFISNPFPLLVNASLFCLSSRYEGRSRTLSEALALGVPIVAADCVAGPKDLLKSGRYGDLVEVGSVTQLADAIESHLRNPARLRKMVNNAQARIDRLSMKTCADSYAQLIRSCVSVRNRSDSIARKGKLHHAMNIEL